MSDEFLEALIDTDGEKSLNNFESFSNKHPAHKYVDYSISEVGEYYYSKGYYVVTDADIVPLDTVPSNFMNKFRNLLDINANYCLKSKISSSNGHAF